MLCFFCLTAFSNCRQSDMLCMRLGTLTEEECQGRWASLCSASSDSNHHHLLCPESSVPCPINIPQPLRPFRSHHGPANRPSHGPAQFLNPHTLVECFVWGFGTCRLLVGKEGTNCKDYTDDYGNARWAFQAYNAPLQALKCEPLYLEVQV